MNQYELIEQKRQERIAEFAENGVKVEAGPFVGWVKLSATDAEKLLKMLRRLKRLEAK